MPGGAPLNVAYHLEKLSASAGMISAVGKDELGQELRQLLESRGLNTDLIATHERLDTGTVGVELSPEGQPSYTIHEPVAWDEIPWSDTLENALEQADALVFGSLAARSQANRSVLERLLSGRVFRVMDVNLRAPYDDRNRVLALAKHANLLKLNEHELALLTGMETDGPWPEGKLAAVEALAAAAHCSLICVTAGELGALLWKDGDYHSAGTPFVQVRDTVGAGDAFTAALVAGVLRGEGWPYPGMLERACAQGALVASLQGGQPDYDQAAVEKLLGR